MNFAARDPPTRLLRGEVPTVQIRLDIAVPDFQCGSIRPFVEVLVEIIGGRYCDTGMGVNSGVVLRTEPGVVRGDPLIGHQEPVLRHHPSVVGPSVLRESAYFYCILSEAFGVPLGAFAAFHAGGLRIYRPSWAAHHRSRYRMPERMFPVLARYYSANNDIVIVSGHRIVGICKDADYVGMRKPFVSETQPRKGAPLCAQSLRLHKYSSR